MKKIALICSLALWAPAAYCGPTLELPPVYPAQAPNSGFPVIADVTAIGATPEDTEKALTAAYAEVVSRYGGLLTTQERNAISMPQILTVLAKFTAAPDQFNLAGWYYGNYFRLAGELGARENGLIVINSAGLYAVLGNGEHPGSQSVGYKFVNPVSSLLEDSCAAMAELRQMQPMPQPQNDPCPQLHAGHVYNDDYKVEGEAFFSRIELPLVATIAERSNRYASPLDENASNNHSIAFRPRASASNGIETYYTLGSIGNFLILQSFREGKEDGIAYFYGIVTPSQEQIQAGTQANEARKERVKRQFLFHLAANSDREKEFCKKTVDLRWLEFSNVSDSMVGRWLVGTTELQDLEKATGDKLEWPINGDDRNTYDNKHFADCERLYAGEIVGDWSKLNSFEWTQELRSSEDNPVDYDAEAASIKARLQQP